MNNSLDSDQTQISGQFKRWTGLGRSALKIEAISFGIGTLLLITFLVSKDEALLPIGLGYVGLAFVVNVIMLLVLIVDMISHTERLRSHLQSAGVLILNIPITWFYLFVIFDEPILL